VLNDDLSERPTLKPNELTYMSAGTGNAFGGVPVPCNEAK